MKDLIGRTSSLSEINHVLTFSVTHALNYLQRSFSEEFTPRTTDFDNILCATNEIISVCTEHAANLVCEQFEITIKIDYWIKQEPHDFMYDFATKILSHFVNIDSNRFFGFFM